MRSAGQCISANKWHSPACMFPHSACSVGPGPEWARPPSGCQCQWQLRRASKIPPSLSQCMSLQSSLCIMWTQLVRLVVHGHTAVSSGCLNLFPMPCAQPLAQHRPSNSALFSAVIVPLGDSPAVTVTPGDGGRVWRWQWPTSLSEPTSNRGWAPAAAGQRATRPLAILNATSKHEGHLSGDTGKRAQAQACPCGSGLPV